MSGKSPAFVHINQEVFNYNIQKKTLKQRKQYKNNDDSGKRRLSEKNNIGVMKLATVPLGDETLERKVR